MPVLQRTHTQTVEDVCKGSDRIHAQVETASLLIFIIFISVHLNGFRCSKTFLLLSLQLFLVPGESICVPAGGAKYVRACRADLWRVTLVAVAANCLLASPELVL